VAIDHRCGARTPLDLMVTVRAQGIGEVRGQVCDISIGGMRIQAQADFTPYQHVTIGFAFPRGSPTRRWQAMVVHAENGTVGVMFEFFRTADLEKLVQLLRAADGQSSAARHATEYDRRSETLQTQSRGRG
jgi:hypothetical protein